MDWKVTSTPSLEQATEGRKDHKASNKGGERMTTRDPGHYIATRALNSADPHLLSPRDWCENDLWKLLHFIWNKK